MLVPGAKKEKKMELIKPIRASETKSYIHGELIHTMMVQLRVGESLNPFLILTLLYHTVPGLSLPSFRFHYVLKENFLYCP